MAKTVIRSRVILPFLFFFCYLILGFLIDFLFFLFGLFALIYYFGKIGGYFGFLLLIGFFLGWAVYFWRKCFVRDLIIIDDKEATLIKGDKELKIPLSQIKKLSITSSVNPMVTLLSVSHAVPFSMRGGLTGTASYMAYKQYYLNINFLENDVERQISFDLSNYRATSSIVKAFKDCGLTFDQLDQDIVDRMWSNPKNRLPFILAIIGFFLGPPTVHSFLPRELKGFNEIIILGTGLATAIIIFILTKKILSIFTNSSRDPSVNTSK